MSEQLTFERRLTPRDREFLRTLCITAPTAAPAQDEEIFVIGQTPAEAYGALRSAGHVYDPVRSHWRFMSNARHLNDLPCGSTVHVSPHASLRLDWPTLAVAIRIRELKVIKL